MSSIGDEGAEGDGGDGLCYVEVEAKVAVYVG